MKTASLFKSAARRGAKSLRLVLLLAFAAAGAARAQQATPKTADITEEISADGAVSMAFEMTFDAAPWRAWKSMVGDEPSRMRAMMRHQFAALTFDNFKLERDDMNRVARMSLHSASGPELRDDGSYQIPVDGYFRLINNAGRVWYFSGNNPNAGNTLNNVKVTLPANATNAYVANPNNPDQALVFALTPAPSPGRWFYVAGAAVLTLGLALLLAGLLWQRRAVQVLPPAYPRALPVAGTRGNAAPAPPASMPPFVQSPGATVLPPPLSPRDGVPPPIPGAGVYTEPE